MSANIKNMNMQNSSMTTIQIKHNNVIFTPWETKMLLQAGRAKRAQLPSADRKLKCTYCGSSCLLQGTALYFPLKSIFSHCLSQGYQMSRFWWDCPDFEGGVRLSQNRWNRLPDRSVSQQRCFVYNWLIFFVVAYKEQLELGCL